MITFMVTGLVICLSVTYKTIPPNRIEVSENKGLDWIVSRFTKGVKTVTPVSEGIEFTMSEGNRVFRTDYYVMKNGDSVIELDHHSHIEYTLIYINSNNATIQYKNTFNFNSFGKRLITVDHGQFIIPFTKLADD